MTHEPQTANLWKRIAAWMLDSIVVGILAAALAMLLSALLGYDGYSETLDRAYETYAGQYGTTFEMTREVYESLTPEEQDRYTAAYNALVADQEAMHAYNRMISLSLVAVSLGLLLAMVLWEFLIPGWLGQGRTLGKRAFGLCLVRSDGGPVNTSRLLKRSILGKYAIETMVPVLTGLMMYWGILGTLGTVVLAALTIDQLFSIMATRSRSAIHDLLAGTVVSELPGRTSLRSAR